MIVRVPYTMLQPATKVTLRFYRGTQFHCLDGSSYAEYWRERWQERQAFINLEHDVVPWSGALEALWSCVGAWCAYGYTQDDDYADRQTTAFPYLGCVKISQELIDLTPGLWDGVEGWEELDKHLAAGVRAAGLDVHQHFPAVTNANPRQLV